MRSMQQLPETETEATAELSKFRLSLPFLFLMHRYCLSLVYYVVDVHTHQQWWLRVCVCVLLSTADSHHVIGLQII